MKITKPFILIIFLPLLIFSSCEKDEPYLTKGEQNAQLIARILDNNTIKFVNIYEFDWAESDWKLAANNQHYNEGSDRFSLDGTYFVLDGSGSKTYVTSNTPTHQLSGFYYFDLEYLVSFELSTDKEELFLYFMYQTK